MLFIKRTINKRLMFGLTMFFSFVLTTIPVNALSPLINQNILVTYASAPANASAQSACSTLNALDSSQSCGNNTSNSVNSLIKTIVTILSLVVGILAVIMIIVSGFKFITSGGEAQKVASAKSGLIYALIGLVIVALAQAIVLFVLNSSSQVVTNSTKKSASILLIQ